MAFIGARRNIGVEVGIGGNLDFAALAGDRGDLAVERAFLEQDLIAAQGRDDLLLVGHLGRHGAGIGAEISIGDNADRCFGELRWYVVRGMLDVEEQVRSDHEYAGNFGAQRDCDDPLQLRRRGGGGQESRRCEGEKDLLHRK